MSEKTKEKQYKFKEKCQDSILPQKRLQKHKIKDCYDIPVGVVFDYDSFKNFCSDQDNIDEAMQNMSGITVTVKESDVSVAIPEKVRLYCEEIGMSIDCFMNVAFNFMVDLLVEGRDTVELKIATRIKNCPYINQEQKHKVLKWCLLRYKRLLPFTFNKLVTRKD